MACLRFTDLQSRPMEFLDLTSLTLEEFQQLVSPFEAAFQTHMAAWRLDGKPRTARQFAVYKNCPPTTPEDRLFFLLTSLKTYSLQVVQGRLFGMGQSKANQWIHALLPVLLAALRTLGDAPARSLTALAQRLGVSEADTATVVTPRAEEPAPVVAVPVAAAAAPLVPMPGRNDASSARKTLLVHHRQGRRRGRQPQRQGHGALHDAPKTPVHQHPREHPGCAEGKNPRVSWRRWRRARMAEPNLPQHRCRSVV